jgi:outer membrane immunogenic protein
MRGTLRKLFLLGTVMAATNLYGQNSRVPFHELDGALTYNAVRSPQVSGGGFWQQGAGFDLWAGSWHGLGPTASLAVTDAGNIGGNGADLTLFTYLFGPRYTWPVPRTIPRTQLHGDLFGEFLIGGAHGSDGVFPAAQGATSSASSFALQLGGGVDLLLAKRVEIRPLQLDWMRTELPNGRDNAQQSLRIGFGVVYRLTGFRKTQPAALRHFR